MSDIQDYFEYVLKEHGEKINDNNNPLIRIYVNKIENRITFEIKTWCYLKLLTPETIKLHGSIESNIKIKNSRHLPYLEITEVVLVHCNLVNNDYQHYSRVLYTFIPNKLFGQLLKILPKNFKLFNAFDSEFSYTEVLFNDKS